MRRGAIKSPILVLEVPYLKDHAYDSAHDYGDCYPSQIMWDHTYGPMTDHTSASQLSICSLYGCRCVVGKLFALYRAGKGQRINKCVYIYLSLSLSW